MSTLVTRSGKGSPLTHNEVDTNFTNLNTDKVEKTAADITGGTINNTTVGATTPSTGVFTTLTATGQTSLGGVAGSESVIVPVSTASGTTVLYAFGGASTGIAGSRIFSGGSASNSSLNFGSKGSGGTIRFFTSATDVTGTWSNNQFQVAHTASAVNYHQLTGSATGSGPIHSVAGSDTNIDLNLTTKGSGGARFNVGNGSKYTYLSSDSANNFQLIGAANTANLGIYATGGGSIRFYTASGLLEEQLRIPQTASAVNFVQVTGAATSGAPVISVQGSDTNITAFYQTKGVGSHVFGTRGTTQQFRISDTGSAVNYLQANGSITGFGPVLSAQGSDTNINAVIQPKGTGALQAQQTDSTATGGNARGANAVDWQTARDTSAKVASGQYAVVSGGYGNVASAFTTFVGGGYTNNASGYNSVVVGGTTNTSSGAYSAIVGGVSNTASKFYNFVGSGQSNTAAGYYNFIGGGFTNSGTANGAVTTQSGTMNATTAVTLSGSNANIKVGQYITGTSIADDTYVSAISGTSLTLSKVASGSSTSTLSFFTPHGVVVGGGNNQATGSYSFIGGGGDAGTAANRNVASGDWSVVAGGQKNVASSNYSFVGGGGYNTASTGNGSVVCGGGFYGNLPPQFAGNTASGVSAFVGAGFSNQATGFASFVGSGNSNVANSAYSTITGGLYGTTRSIIGLQVFPAHNGPVASVQGVSQAALLVLGVETTNATATVLRSDTSAANTTNQVILPNNSAYYFRGEVVSGVTGGGNTKGWYIEGVIKRGANAASTALVGTPTVTSNYADAGASTWTIAVTADTTNGGLAVTFTGQAATTIRTVCRLNTTEMTY